MDVAQGSNVRALLDTVTQARPRFDTLGRARLVAETEWGEADGDV